jgi:hypothetical protein
MDPNITGMRIDGRVGKILKKSGVELTIPE